MTNSRIANRIPNDLAGSGWYDILPDAQPQAMLNDNIETDWLVIGAGFAGCHATRRLLKHDQSADIVLLEAQNIGFGACGRNSGFMIDLPHELQSDDYSADANHSANEIRLNRTALDFAGACADEFDLHQSLQRVGKYHGAADAAGASALNKFCQGLERLGEPFRTLDAQQMQAVTGSTFYHSGIHTPGCTMLQPAGYIRGLVEGMNNTHASLRVYANSPALEIHPSSNGGAHKVITPGGTIKTNRIILTVNGHLESFGWHQQELMHVFTFASMTEALSDQDQEALGGEPAWGLVSAHPMGTTVRRTLDHRIVVRNTFTYNPSMETSTHQVNKLGKRHDRSFLRRFPSLGHLKMSHRWGGHLCLSRNSTAVFGELESNIYAACCHNGLGTSKGTLGGMLIADHACGLQSDDIDELLNAAPPARLPPPVLMTPAARTYLAIAQWRAGKDL